VETPRRLLKNDGKERTFFSKQGEEERSLVRGGQDEGRGLGCGKQRLLDLGRMLEQVGAGKKNNSQEDKRGGNGGVIKMRHSRRTGELGKRGPKQKKTKGFLSSRGGRKGNPKANKIKCPDLTRIKRREREIRRRKRIKGLAGFGERFG